MFTSNWITVPAFIWFWAWTGCFNLSINGQSQNAIGAHRAFQKTSFSCVGRPSGYYADVETGCQVYHMCDGLGRQFSYSCPNTTLFQQRMLICDHWYMVNCSKAESNYAANLLIGQRDKPFVNDEENNLRTPRPDLLDRPYAPDYSGESFRNQYKHLPAAQNQIQDSNAQKTIEKTAQTSQLAPGQQRWKIPPPSRTILPPAYEPQIEADPPSTTKPQQNGVRFVPTTKAGISTTLSRFHSSTTSRTTAKTTTTRRPTAPASAPISRKQQSNSFNNAALHQRQQESIHADHDDLGTSHSTRYNTSGDFNSAEAASKKTLTAFSKRKSITNTATTTTGSLITTTTKMPIKVPSKIYEPPFLYPIYNQEETPSTEKPLRVSTATPFTAPSRTRTRDYSTTTTTTRTPSRPTTLAGKPFTVASSATPIANTGRNQNNLLQQMYTQNSRFDSPQKHTKTARTPTPAQGFKPPTPRPPVNSAKTLKPPTTTHTQKTEASAFDYKIPTTSRLSLPSPFIGASSSSSRADKPELPAKDLLPPLQDFVQHDIATTQGPPIYYEWKVPSNGLEPPKLEAPIGVDGREYPETVIDYNNISTSSGLTPQTSTFGIDQPKKSYANNPFLVGKTPTNNELSTTRTPTSRSIKETAQPNSLGTVSSTKTTTRSSSTSSSSISSSDTTPSDITKLRNDLSVPEYAFPLENIGRTGYLSADTYNSFQLKIPERRIDTDGDHQHWFGENPKCPECHPSYVVQGTCAPCLRR